MSVEVTVAIISGIATIAAIVINSALSNKEVTAKLDKSQTVMQTKLEDLTREVREHNDFARKIPIIQEQIKAIDRRLSNLEGAIKNER